MVREIELCSAKPKPCSLPPLSFLSWPCSWKILIYFNSLFSCQLPICHDILISVLRKPRYHSWIHDSVRDVLDVFVTSCRILSRSNSVAPWILKIRLAADSPLQSRASSFKVQWLHDSAILSAGVACTSGGWCRLMLWCVAGSRHCLLSALKQPQSLRCGAYADQPGRSSIWRTASGWDPSSYPPRSTEWLCFMRWHATI